MKNSTPVKYGIIGGLLMITCYVLMYLMDAAMLASWITLTLYLLLIICMIFGGITYRKEIGGYKSYGEAFLAVFIIAIIGALLIDSFGVLLFKVIDPSLPDIIKEATIANTEMWMEKFNTPEDKMEEQLRIMRAADYAPSLKSQLARTALSLSMSVLFSLLIAVFVRRNDRTEAVA